MKLTDLETSRLAAFKQLSEFDFIQQYIGFLKIVVGSLCKISQLANVFF